MTSYRYGFCEAHYKQVPGFTRKSLSAHARAIAKHDSKLSPGYREMLELADTSLRLRAGAPALPPLVQELERWERWLSYEMTDLEYHVYQELRRKGTSRFEAYRWVIDGGVDLPDYLEEYVEGQEPLTPEERQLMFKLMGDGGRRAALIAVMEMRLRA